MTQPKSVREAPRYLCDLILKGGITSGVVYPPAIVELSRDHKFCSIGGASAGAIAAASAAAAELGRDSPSGGFARLAQVPDELAETDDQGETRLRRLFQAQRETRPLFDLIWTVRESEGTERVRRILKDVSCREPAPRSVLWWGLTAWAVVVALGVAAFAIGGAGSLLASVPLILLVTAAWITAVRAGRIYSGARSLAEKAPVNVSGNFHGLCNGATPEDASDAALTDWLYETLQALAGRGDDDVRPERRSAPVTYGELAEAEVRLVTITTDLSHGTSESFPLRTGGWAFSEEELRRLFPAAVVDHLVRHPAESEDAQRVAALEREGLRSLPAPEDLPIIMGARISLSFPLLISAVPLYAWRPRPVSGGGWEMCFQKSWFSDGGITSNLPVHLFDRPLPTRPTYAINLDDGGDPTAGAWANIWRPIDARAGRLTPVAPITSTLDLLSAVFNTMQNWADNSLARAAGQRDRIVKVRLGKGEGGLNLDMGAETIGNLAKRGTAAGQNLGWIQRGVRPDDAPPDQIRPEVASQQWDRHRFTRYRTFLAGLGRYMKDAHEGTTTESEGRMSYAALAAAAVKQDWLPYRDGWTARRQREAAEVETRLFGLDTTVMTETPPAGAALGFDPHGPEEPESSTSATDASRG